MPESDLANVTQSRCWWVVLWPGLGSALQPVPRWVGNWFQAFTLDREKSNFLTKNDLQGICLSFIFFICKFPSSTFKSEFMNSNLGISVSQNMRLILMFMKLYLPKLSKQMWNMFIVILTANIVWRAGLAVYGSDNKPRTIVKQLQILILA